MFCPKCKCEYVAGITRCIDCDLPLVEKLPQSNPALDRGEELPHGPIEELWSGDDQTRCVSICLQLKEGGIPFRVTQPGSHLFSGEAKNYRVAVPAEALGRARELVGNDPSGFSSPEGETPDNAEGSGEAVSQEQSSDDSLADDSEADAERAQMLREERDWREEDATAQVWSQSGASAAEMAGMIKDSLRENGIFSRRDVQDDGLQKIFVLPEDKARGLEIVREIETGTPPR